MVLLFVVRDFEIVQIGFEFILCRQAGVSQESFFGCLCMQTAVIEHFKAFIDDN